ncbi:MAG: DUF3016 domain-containing protein [Massilia sp.]
MKPKIRQLALAGMFLLSAGAASAAVKVVYVQPENFADIPFTTWERDDVLKELTRHFTKLGEALPPGQDLNIEVLDIDLAGRAHPGRGTARDIRILRGGADWPRMHLRYTLESNGNVIKRGDDQLSDMMYLDHISQYRDGDTLRYEKQMIDDWFEKNIGPRKPKK